MNEEEDRAKRFLDEVFGPEDDNPSVIRNVGCRFTDQVVDYLFQEWEVDLTHYPHHIQNKAMDVIDKMKNEGQNPVNAAGRIAMTVLPI